MSDGRPAIRFEGITKIYAGGVQAVDGVTFEVARGAFVVLLGPSGCGKTTLLKIVNRLYEPTSGRLYLDADDALAVDPVLLRRRIGYVIQQVGLFPHMTIAENIAVVPTLLNWLKPRIEARTDELLALVHLDPATYRGRYPRELSGGQQQRVGLARALAADPSVLLMDEPFGAVDAIERSYLQDELAALHAKVRATILFVTHDVDEALRLADVLVVMRTGKVEQLGTPLEILAHPASEFVSALVDAGDVVRRFGIMKVGAAMERLPEPAGAETGQRATIARSETLRVALSRLLAEGADALTVVDGDGGVVGRIGWNDLREAARAR